jgi:hypothetical protein
MDWKDFALGGSALMQLALVIFFLIRISPSLKEIRIKELDVRVLEVEGTKQMAAALGQLGTGLQTMSETLNNIAVEQRHATDTIKILQRVNADQSDELTRNVTIITDRVDRLEKRYDEFQRTQPHEIGAMSRVDNLPHS